MTSVVARLLLAHLIRAGNLVNVSSLIYPVPAGTACLDWLQLGSCPALRALGRMAAILAGL